MNFFPSKFVALTAVAQIILMAVTWPLWFCDTDYPQIALFTAASGSPILVHQVLSSLLVAGCGLLANSQWKTADQVAASQDDIGRKSGKWLPTSILLCAVGLVILDQHRLQPWHWLTMLLLVEWRLLNASDFLKAARITLATIYVFASVSRFGPDVASGMSGQVLAVILQALDLNLIKPNDGRFVLLATAMNGIECLIGLALLYSGSQNSGTRKAGVVAAVLLHMTLVLCLSPLGLNHHVGVLVWNTFLMLAVPCLFWTELKQTPVESSSVPPSPAHLSPLQPTPQQPQSTPPQSAHRQSATVKLVIAVVVLIPTAGLFGFADNWLAWQVYSPRPEVLRLTVDIDSVPFLPAMLKPFVQAPAPLQSDCPIRLDRWSLQSKHVPIYPEDRFQIATAKWVVSKAVANGAARSAFKAQLEYPQTFPWWKRKTVDIDL